SAPYATWAAPLMNRAVVHAPRSGCSVTRTGPGTAITSIRFAAIVATLSRCPRAAAGRRAGGDRTLLRPARRPADHRQIPHRERIGDEHPRPLTPPVPAPPGSAVGSVPRRQCGTASPPILLATCLQTVR